MYFSLGANATTKDGLKIKIAEANAQGGGLMPRTAGDILDAAIDALPDIEGTYTGSISGEAEGDPAVVSRLTMSATTYPASPPTP